MQDKQIVGILERKKNYRKNNREKQNILKMKNYFPW